MKRRLQRTSLGKELGLTKSAAYIRAGRSVGRGTDDGPAAEVDGSGRDNVVVGASGSVSVGGIDELGKDVPNNDVAVT